MGQIFVAPQFQALNGVSSKPGAKLEFFATGTTTQVDTFSDIGLTPSNVHSNPVEANGDGVFPAIFADDFSVIKAVLTDKDGALIGFKVADPASGSQVSGQFQEWNTATTYDLDDTVQASNGFFYESIIDPNEGNDPTTIDTAWSKIVITRVWNTNQTYTTDDKVVGSDGITYTSVSAINTGNDPVTDDGTNWDRTLTKNTDFVDLISGRRNLVINGDGIVNQRQISIPINSGENAQDRWIILSDGNDIVSPSQELSDLPDGFRSAIKLSVQAPNAKFGIFQILESLDSRVIIDLVASLSSSQRADGLTNARVAIVSWNGVSESATKDLVTLWNNSGTDPTLATNWNYESTPVNISLSALWQSGFDALNVSVDTASAVQVGVFLWIDDTDATGGDAWYVTGTQLEQNSIATGFEYRTVSEELILCQRFFEKSYDSGDAPGSATSDGAKRYVAASTDMTQTSERFNVNKRVQPTVTLFSITGAANTIRDVTAAADLAASASNVSETGFAVTKTAVHIDGNTYQYGYDANAEYT